MIKQWGPTGINLLHPNLFWHEEDTPWRGPGAHALFGIREIFKKKLNPEEKKRMMGFLGVCTDIPAKHFRRFFSFHGQIPIEGIGNIKIAWKQGKVIMPSILCPDKYDEMLGEFRDVINEIIMHFVCGTSSRAEPDQLKLIARVNDYYQLKLKEKYEWFTQEIFNPFCADLQGLPFPIRDRFYRMARQSLISPGGEGIFF